VQSEGQVKACDRNWSEAFGTANATLTSNQIQTALESLAGIVSTDFGLRKIKGRLIILRF